MVHDRGVEPECHRDWRQVGWVSLAYAGLTGVMTWPMIIRLSLPFYKVQGDYGLWLWDLWWMKKALVDLRTSPYFTSYLFYPTGTSLIFHNLSPSNGLLGIPLQLLGADVITTYNLLYLLSFVIGGVGMFLLVRELTGNAFAGFFGGAIYAFSPFRTAAYAWMNLWAIQWLPFALWFTVRLLRVGERRDSIGLAVSLALVTLSDWHQPVMLGLAIALLALSVTVRPSGIRCPPGAFRHLISGLVLFGVLVSPIGYAVLRELATGDTLRRTATWFNQFELLGMRYPGWNVISYGVLLGWVPLGVAAYGAIRGLDPWMKRFAALGAGFFVLALGEGLRIPGIEGPVLPLPFLLWRRIPLLGTMRSSVYFWTMVAICFAVLAGHGAKRLWERTEVWEGRRRSAFRLALGAVLLALALGEALQAPLSPVPLRVHPVYEAMRRQANPHPILDAPLGYAVGNIIVNSGRSMFLQTIHEHPLIGGYTQFDGRTRLEFLARNPALRLFMVQAEPPPLVESQQESELRSLLADLGVAWVILQRGLSQERGEACEGKPRSGWTGPRVMAALMPAVFNRELRSVWHWRGHCLDWMAHWEQSLVPALRRVLGPPVWDDEELVVYRVP